MAVGKLYVRAAAAVLVVGWAHAMRRGVAEAGMFEEEVDWRKACLYQ